MRQQYHHRLSISHNLISVVEIMAWKTFAYLVCSPNERKYSKLKVALGNLKDLKPKKKYPHTFDNLRTVVSMQVSASAGKTSTYS